MSTHRAIVVGDTQATLLVERLVGREHCPHVRRRLFRELAHEEGELALFLGDLVAYDAPHHWARIDPLLDRLRERGTFLAAAVGNHDVFPAPRRGLGALADRGLLPNLRSYQERDVGNVRFVVLDSNRRVLGEDAWARQVAWLRERVAVAEASDDVRAIVLVTHHPPWTNSLRASDAEGTLLPFVEAFERAKKASVWLSGHVHAYERFTFAGKTLVVSGSTGSPRMRLLEGPLARHADRARLGSPGPFAWLRVHVEKERAHAELVGFFDERAPTGTLDTFAI
jgi:3',5'-cyclic AMP phosphodiesterase CpdA